VATSLPAHFAGREAEKGGGDDCRGRRVENLSAPYNLTQASCISDAVSYCLCAQAWRSWRRTILKNAAMALYKAKMRVAMLPSSSRREVKTEADSAIRGTIFARLVWCVSLSSLSADHREKDREHIRAVGLWCVWRHPIHGYGSPADFILGEEMLDS